MILPLKYAALIMFTTSIVLMNEKHVADPIIRINVSLRIEDNERKFKPIMSKVAISYYKCHTIIEDPRPTISMYFQSDSSSHSFEHIRSSKTIKSRYFIFKNKSTQGLAFDSLAQKKGTRFNVDTIMKEKAFSNGMFYNSSTYNFVESIIKPKDDYTSAIEIFSRDSKENLGSKDSLIYHFTNQLKDVPYSFSPALDQNEKGKIYKIEIFYYEKFKNGLYQNSFRKMKAVLEVSREEVEDDLIVKYFDKYITETFPNKK